MTDFSVVASRYILCDGKHVCTVLRDEDIIADILVEHLNQYEPTEYALAILDKMISGPILKYTIREAWATDKNAISARLNPGQSLATKEKFGGKHVCAKCKQKFYDLNGRISECPACKMPITAI